MSDEAMEPHLREAVTAMLAQNRSAPGDYAIVLHAAVLEDGSTVYEWRWYWSPRAPVRQGKL